MTKITVAVLIIGAFLVYSFVHSQSNSAALTPRLSTETATATSASTSTSSVAAANTPTPTTPVATTPTPAPTTAPTAPATAPASTATASGKYKDGTYTGNVTDAQWGYVQVKAVVSQGKIASVQFVQYPNDRSRSQYINSIADPELISEAIQAQGAQVDIITGATDSSVAFIQSLTNALSQATS